MFGRGGGSPGMRTSCKFSKLVSFLGSIGDYDDGYCMKLAQNVLVQTRKIKAKNPGVTLSGSGRSRYSAVNLI